MFGFDIVLAFLAGMIWYELVFFGVLLIGCGFSLKFESSLGFIIPLAILLGVNWTGSGSAIALLSTMPFLSILWIALMFIIIGVIWSFFKWRNLVKEVIDYSKNCSIEAVKERISNKKNYDVVAFWIILWPFSVLGYIINDFVYDIVTKFIDKIYSIYDRITDKMLLNSGLVSNKEAKND